MEELDAIVHKLEGGVLSLDDSLAAYERAITLVRFATAKLEDAKQRVRVLEEKKDGTVTDAPFVVSGDET